MTPATVSSVGSPVPPAAQLTTQLQLSDGVTFSSTPGYAALIDLGFGQATSGTNGIGGVSAAGLFDYLVLEITFSMPGDPSTPALTNFVAISGDNTPIAGSATLEAFDIDGLLLASVTAPDAVGLTLSLTPPGIHSLRVTGTSGTIAFDDLQFNELTPVPEPATGVLVGVAALVCAVRARWRQRGRLTATASASGSWRRRSSRATP